MTNTKPIDGVDGLIAVARVFHERGWMLGTSGNLSVRLPLGKPAMAITCSGVSKGLLTYDDIVVLPEDQRSGLFTRGDTIREPSAEAEIHETIYKCVASANAVLHVHTVASTALSRSAAVVAPPPRVIVQGLEMLKGLGVVWRDGSLNAEIPVLPNRPDMAKLAEEVEALLMDGVTLPVLLVAGHGLTAWGHTIEQARDHLEAAEFVCQVLWEEWRQIDRRGC